VLRSSSDRFKIAVCLCAIVSSAMTLAAYFGLFDLAAERMARADVRSLGPLNMRDRSQEGLLPSGLDEFRDAPVVSS
jgi:hypothetical protein